MASKLTKADQARLTKKTDLWCAKFNKDMVLGSIKSEKMYGLSVYDRFVLCDKAKKTMLKDAATNKWTTKLEQALIFDVRKHAERLMLEMNALGLLEPNAENPTIINRDRYEVGSILSMTSQKTKSNWLRPFFVEVKP